MTVPSWWYRDIGSGVSGRDVVVVHRLLAAPLGVMFGEDDAVQVRGIQAAAGLPATGVVDAATAAVMGERTDIGLIPVWFVRDLSAGYVGWDVMRARELLEVPPGTLYDPEVDAAVRRFRSARGLPLSGVLDATVATLLGE